MAQVAEMLLEAFGSPEWVFKTLLALFLIGFPFALFFAWAFELTHDGLKRTEEVEAGSNTKYHPMRNTGLVVIGLLVLILGYFSYDRATVDPVTIPQESPAQPAASSETRESISLAVLPFVNMSSDKEQEYFSDGISEELLNVLANAGGIEVASRTSAFAFKGKDRNISEIAKILKVDHVLEGSVRRSGSTIRITAQLIDAATDKHIWSDTYDREFTDVFKVQDEIANKIVTALSEKFGIKAGVVSVEQATTNMGAYDLYLQALAAARIFGYEGEVRRIALLREAVSLDPDFLEAILLLSLRLNYLPTWNASLDNKTYNDEALFFANRALEMAPGDARVHHALAQIAFRAYRFDDMQKYIKTALAIDPGNRGFTLHMKICLGYFQDSLELADEILNTDTADSWVHVVKMLALEGMGETDAALRSMKDAFFYGYTGMAEIVLLDDAYRKGDRVTWGAVLALVMNKRSSREADYPLLRLLPQLESIVFADEADKDSEIARFWMVAKDLGYDRQDILGPYRYATILALKEYGYLADQLWGSETKQWMWIRSFSKFRQSEPFKRKIRESGILAHWKKYGWPDLCHAVGDDDFSCN
jgi:TolB-like protein/tetratricopeptide (TPR) repeat protein